MNESMSREELDVIRAEAERRGSERNKRTVGLYHKYNVSRTDGSSDPGGKHDGCHHFVLDIDHDPFALVAIAAYSEACKGEYPVLAEDLEVISAQTSTETPGMVTDVLGNKFHLHGGKIAQPDYAGRCLLCP